MADASFISAWYACFISSVTSASGGARAGAATKSCGGRQQGATSRTPSTHQSGVADELPREPEERLLEVVVRLGRDVVVLQVLFAVEGDGLGLDFALLDIDLVAAQHDRYALAHAHEIACEALAGDLRGHVARTVPVWHVLVRDTRRHVKHDDTALAVDVVAVAEPAKLLLAGRVPDVELDRAVVLRASSAATASAAPTAERGEPYRGETQRVNFDAERGNVALLKLARQVALDEGGLQAGPSAALGACTGADVLCQSRRRRQARA